METLKGNYSQDELIDLEATRRGLDPKLIRGIVRTESSEDPAAKSHKGARGLMQLMPATAKWRGFTGNDEDLHDPKVNVSLGVDYFKYLLDKYKGDVPKALSAYNQGPGNLAKEGIDNPEYAEKVKQQSFQGGGKVGVFDRPVSPQRMKPGQNSEDLEAIIERALGKVLGNFAGGGEVPGYAGGGYAGATSGMPSPRTGGIRTQGGGFGALLPQGAPGAPGTQGGLIGEAAGATRGINANLTGVNQSIESLNQFNPFSGQGGQTMNQLLATGAPVDVNPITQANIQQGSQVYNQLTAPQIDEQFGAMGLGSSSSRTAALAREAGNVASNIGAEGLRAGVGAQESAQQRRLGALSPYSAGQGQKLGAIESGGQLGLGGAGLNLQGQTAKAGGLSGLGLGLLPTFNQQFADGGLVEDEYAQGGRVDVGDYLSNLIFGQQFNRNPRQVAPSMRSPSGQNSRMSLIQEAMGREQLKQLQMPRKRSIDDEKLDIVQSLKRLSSQPREMQDFGTYKQTNELKALLGQISGGGGGAGLSFEGINRNPGARVQNQRIADFYRRSGQVPPQQKAQGGYVMDTGEWDDGGQVNGPSFPPDRVHVMAQGGEGILPLEMMDRLKEYDSDDPMLNEIKGLLFDPEQKQKFAGGGLIHGLTENTYGVDELAEAGGKNYPELPTGSRHHAEGTRKLSELVGFLPTQLAGLGVEGVERLISGQWGDIGPDLIANIIGGAEGAVNRQIPGLDLGTKIRKGVQGKAQGGKVEKVMHEFGAGTLHSGSASGPQVTDRKQAIAIAMSEQRKAKAGKYAHGGQIPTGQQSRINLQNPLEVNLGTGPGVASFGNQDLAGYAQPSSAGVTYNAPEVDIDSIISRRDLEREQENSRAALYDMLGATASAGARAKLGALSERSRAKVDAADKELESLYAVKTAREQAAAQLAFAQTQQQALEEYRKGQLGLGQGRLDVSKSRLEGDLGLGDGQPQGISQLPEEQAGVVNQGLSEPSGTQAVAGRTEPGNIGASAMGAITPGATGFGAMKSQRISPEEAFGFKAGSVPGANGQEIARNAAMMQTPAGLVQVIQLYGPTPSSIAQAKKFVAMFASMPVNDQQTAQAVQLLSQFLATGG